MMKKIKRILCLMLAVLFLVGAPVSAAAQTQDDMQSLATSQNRSLRASPQTGVAIPPESADILQKAAATKGNTTQFAGGSGTANDPYIIKTKAHLNNVRNYLSAHFRLDADIAFDASDFEQDGEFYNNGTGWQPIGTYITSFTGVFDGNGHTVSGLKIYIDRLDNYAYAGLFAKVSGGTVRNLKLEYMNILVEKNVDFAYVGGIAGSIDNAGVIKNCSVSGSISAVTVETCTTGGIVGRLDGIVQNCRNSAYIECKSSSSSVNVGGIAGIVCRETNAIGNCRNMQSVTGKGYSETHAGGIVGDMGGMASDNTDAVATVAQCYNTASVTATTQRNSVADAGGIAGCLSSDVLISDCYNAGDIYTNEINSDYSFNFRCAGGIVGRICDYRENQLARCYNVGKITDMPNITSSASMIGGTGAIVGKAGNGVTVASCYYMDNMAKGIGNGSVLGTATSYTKNEMLQKSTYAGFDFESSWEIDGSAAYPYPTLCDSVVDYPDYSIVLYSDYPNLGIPVGEIATFYVGVLTNNGLSTNTDGITFALTEGYIMNMVKTGVTDNMRYIQFKGLTPGTTMVTFSDSQTGTSLILPITVYNRTTRAYTLESVPKWAVSPVSAWGEYGVCNMYNYNGMYMENYAYELTEAKDFANVSFDIYNTSRVYGIVESYYENGTLYDAKIIDKTVANPNTSIYATLIEQPVYIIKDTFSGELLSYRSEGRGASKLTHIDIAIPKNGYIKITNDPLDSYFVEIINLFDMAIATASIYGSIDIKLDDYPDLHKDLLKELVKIMIDKGLDMFNFGKQFGLDSVKLQTANNYLSADNCMEFILDMFCVVFSSDTLNEFITKFTLEQGIDMGEDFITTFSGVAGWAMNVVFAFSKIENVYIQTVDYRANEDTGNITIQYNSGDYLTCEQIKVKYPNGIDSETALSVYKMALSDEKMAEIKEADSKVYTAIRAGNACTYNISLIKDQQEVQPGSNVTVYIPIPSYLEKYVEQDQINMYRVEADGSLTQMDCSVENGMIWFITDHFSIYTMVGFGAFVAGDLNGDEAVTDQDAIYLLLHTLLGDKYPVEQDCDFNGDGAVTDQDAIYLLLHTLLGDKYPIE